MFRTSNLRGQKRFDYFRFSKLKKNGKLKLSKKQIELIENTQVLDLSEKIELLLVSLGNKLTTELYMNENLAETEKLLKQLPFVYFKDHLPNKKNRQTGKLENFTWFQVSVNEAAAQFMKKYPDDLTEFEEGILYGFPLSAIRAFSGLIESKHTKPSPAAYYMAGVCSKDFWEDEQAYYQLWWSRLKKLSPKIVTQAEKKYHKLHPQL